MSDEPEKAEVIADVIELRPGFDMDDEQRMLHRGKRPEPYCHHQRYRLDPESRRVFCGECGREVPAFDALDHLAREVERYISERKEMQRRMREAAAQVVEVERLERNAKARVRNAVKKAPACSCPKSKRARLVRYAPGPWCALCGGRRGDDE